MQAMSYTRSNGYIYPKMIRQYYLFCGLLTSIGLLLFALFMFWVGLTQSSSKLPCFIVAVFFAVLHIIYVTIWLANYHIVRATYYVGNFEVFNQIGSQMICVPLSKSNQEELKYTFSLGYARFVEEYVILYENLPAQIIRGNIYKIMRTAWKCGAVILPKAKL